MKVAADAQLSDLHFTGSENLARTANRIVLGMGKVVDVVDVGSDFRCEKFRIQRSLFGSRISVQPREIRERKRLARWRFGCCQLAFVGGLRLDCCGGALRKQIRARWRCARCCDGCGHSRSRGYGSG